MLTNNMNPTGFFSEMSERQLTATEFFSDVLLDSLHRHFGLENMLISYFDTHGLFLSWIDQNGIQTDSDDHPYHMYSRNDIIRHIVYQDAVRDHLTYFNVTPRLYKSTDIIQFIDYDQSAYVNFIEKHFHAHYSVSMAFGINAYIQLTFFKSKEAGDFMDEELDVLNKIYIYVANSYKTFKKHEQAKIISNIQNRIIASGDKAYLVTDDFTHIMSYNKTAQQYLEDMLGTCITEELTGQTPSRWLPFLLGEEEEQPQEGRIQTRVIKDYIFKIYTYDQNYSNGIVDRYHWITISKKEAQKNIDYSATKLTKTEQRVAELMYHNLTYKAIADELVVSYHTVKNHVQNIYAKCGVKSRFELYKWLENRETQ